MAWYYALKNYEIIATLDNASVFIKRVYVKLQAMQAFSYTDLIIIL